jgi:hypothetical protein
MSVGSYDAGKLLIEDIDGATTRGNMANQPKTFGIPGDVAFNNVASAICADKPGPLEELKSLPVRKP